MVIMVIMDIMDIMDIMIIMDIMDIMEIKHFMIIMEIMDIMLMNVLMKHLIVRALLCQLVQFIMDKYIQLGLLFLVLLLFQHLKNLV